MRFRSLLVLLIIGLLWGGGVFAQSETTAPSNEDLNVIMYDYLGDITQQGTSKIDLLINQQETSGTRKGIIEHFCSTFLNTREAAEDSMRYFDYAGFRYDPRQSLFMYQLCTNVDRDKYAEVFEFTYPDERISFNLEDYLQESSKKGENWSIDEEVADNCNPLINNSLQSCDFSSVHPEIFKSILNDISNIKLATIYGYRYGNKLEDRQKAIEQFSTSYFGDPNDPMVPCRDGDVHYLNPETVEGDKKHCSHPKTYNLVDETIKSAERLINKTTMLKSKEILQQECEEPKADLFACAFNNHGRFFGESDWHVFQNLYMNEWMFYSLFSEYYIVQIRNSPEYNTIGFGDITAAAQRNADEIETLRYELRLTKSALNQMVRILEQVRVSYPIHVGLMAYMEDLINYRNAIISMRTPLHQLYYTLRNAQSCQE